MAPIAGSSFSFSYVPASSIIADMNLRSLFQGDQ